MGALFDASALVSPRGAVVRFKDAEDSAEQQTLRHNVNPCNRAYTIS